MQVIDDAIVTLYNGVSAQAVALRALCNGIWRAEDPDRPNVPFIRYSEISADTERIFGGDQMEDTVYQLSIFSESHNATEIQSIWAAMIALFDDADLTVSGYDHIAMLRDSHGGPEVEAGQYHYWARYRILIDE